MIKKEITTECYVLEERDIRTIKKSLNYIKHRIYQHDKCKFISVSEVLRISQELGL